MTLEYKEAQTNEGMERIAEFLGQKAGRFKKSETVKRNSSDILSRFSNPGEAETFLISKGLEN